MNDRFIEEFRNDLLEMNGGNSVTQSTSTTRSTKTDNKLKAKLSIRDLSDRLKNAANELGRLHDFFLLMSKYIRKEKKIICFLN